MLSRSKLLRCRALVAAGVLCLAICAPSQAIGADTPAENPGAAESWIKSARSGPWSAAATWEGGKVPGSGARVQVRTGHVVVYDAKTTAPLRVVHVAGTLRFAHDRDT